MAKLAKMTFRSKTLEFLCNYTKLAKLAIKAHIVDNKETVTFSKVRNGCLLCMTLSGLRLFLS